MNQKYWFWSLFSSMYCCCISYSIKEHILMSEMLSSNSVMSNVLLIAHWIIIPSPVLFNAKQKLTIFHIKNCCQIVTIIQEEPNQINYILMLLHFLINYALNLQNTTNIQREFTVLFVWMSGSIIIITICWKSGFC